MSDSLPDTITTTTTRDKNKHVTGTTTTRTTNTNSPDSAYVWNKSKKAWVKPPNSVGKGAVWIPNVGWQTQSSQASEWGYQISVIKSDKGLNQVFTNAWNAERSGSAWTAEKFTNAIKSTTWYKTRSAAQRKYDLDYGKGKGSPEYINLQSRIATQTAAVRAAAANQGVHLSDKELNQIGVEATRNGYSDIELNTIFSNHLKAHKEGIKGFFDSISGTTGVGADKNNILKWAKDNGVTVSNDWVSGQLNEILSGKHDVQSSKDYITNLAKLAYPAHADGIDAKTSVMDRAQTYAQKISSMLEVPFESVDLNNDYLKNALNPGEDGKPKNLTQVEQELRGSADWGKTNNAKETANSVVNNILNKFGLM